MNLTFRSPIEYIKNSIFSIAKKLGFYKEYNGSDINISIKFTPIVLSEKETLRYVKIFNIFTIKLKKNIKISSRHKYNPLYLSIFYFISFTVKKYLSDSILSRHSLDSYIESNKILKLLIHFAPKLSFKKYDEPSISIIIPVYNNFISTINCLKSIHKYARNISFEIILIDDYSNDATLFIHKFINNIIIVRNKKNLGYIKSCNHGANISKGKFLYFMNNDTIAHKDWLHELIETFSYIKNAGVVGSKIVRLNGKLQEVGLAIYNDKIVSHIDPNPNSNSNNYLKKVDYVSGCSLMTPKKLFQKIGGFDEIYAPAYCDDSDYCMAVTQEGYSVYVQPSSLITHLGSCSYNTTSIDLMRRNNVLLRKKWANIFNNKVNYSRYRYPFSSKTRPITIIIIDYSYPKYDKNAGSKTIFNFIETFIKMGLNVKFCPYEAIARIEPYYSLLCKMGVEIIEANSIYNFINKNIVDYIVISRPYIFKHFRYNKFKEQGIKVIYYGHDVHHLRMQRECEFNNNINKNDIEDMKLLEIYACKNATISLYPSNYECEYMQNLIPDAKFKQITPYMYSNYLPSHNSYSESNGIIFVGSSHPPNLDGIKWFFQEIYPHLKINELKIHLVGLGNYKYLKKIANNNNNIIIHPYLNQDDLDKLYSNVRLSIAPLRYGAGIKGKVIDAIYHRTPVVTTKIGAEGIPECNAIKIANTNESYIEAIMNIYSNEKIWNEITEDCVDLIKNNYSFNYAIKQFNSIITSTERENKLTN